MSSSEQSYIIFTPKVGLSLTDKIEKELLRFISLDFRRQTFQDFFIKPLTFNTVHYTNIFPNDNICPSHTNVNGDPTYCVKTIKDTRYTIGNVAVRSDKDNFNFTRELGAQNRWLTSLICEASQQSKKIDNKTKHHKKLVLPDSFELLDNSFFFKVLKQCGPKHFLPHLSQNDLLNLSGSCKFMNNFVNTHTFSGLAIRFARSYGKVIKEYHLPVSLLQTQFIIQQLLDQCIRVSSNCFTAYSRNINKQLPLEDESPQIEILQAYDAGDATIVDNPEADGDCYVIGENRKLFLIKIGDNYFNLALILYKPYGGFRHATWEKPGNRLGDTLPAKEIIPRFLQALVKIARVRPFEFARVRKGNRYKQVDLKLLKLLDDMNFSRKRPEENQIPFGSFSSLPLSLEDLTIITGSKDKVLNELAELTDEAEYNMFYKDFEEFAESGMEEMFEQKLKTIISPLVLRLATIAYSAGASDFMELWHYHSLLEKERINLPLHKIRFPPKEWPLHQNKEHYSLGEKEGDQEVDEHYGVTIRGWYELFTRRDTINKGSIVFEN